MRAGSRTGFRHAGIRYGAAAAAILAALAIALAAHRASDPGARLAGITPVDGAHLASAPTEVVLEFSQPVDAATVHVEVRGPGQAVVSGARSVSAGSRVVQPVGIARAGGYRITYHLWLGDGSPVSGSSVFTVGAGEPPPDGGGHVHLRRDPLSLGLVALDLVLVGLLLVLLVGRRRNRRGAGLRRRRREG